jgi:hypothetical protein
MAEEIKIIKERVEEKKAQIEKAQLPQIPEKEIVKETISERIEDSLKNLPPTISEKFTNKPLPSTLSVSNKDPEAQKLLQELVNIAFNESIPKAVELARKTGNSFLIDSLHDILVKSYIEKNPK